MGACQVQAEAPTERRTDLGEQGGLRGPAGKAWGQEQGAQEGQRGHRPVTSPLREGMLLSLTRATAPRPREVPAGCSRGQTGAAGCAEGGWGFRLTGGPERQAPGRRSPASVGVWP